MPDTLTFEHDIRPLFREEDAPADLLIAGAGSHESALRAIAGGSPICRSCSSAVCTIVPSAPSAEPAATGSVASAATSNAGLSPRRTARSKPRGISTPNSTLPDCRRSSNSATLWTSRVKRK